MQTRSKSFVFHRWFQLLIAGLVLYIATNAALAVTGNPNFFPTLLMVGAFTVPVVFVTFVYEHEYIGDVPISCLAVCFLVGGIIGIITAGVIEYATLQTAGVIELLGVGLIEESSKLIMPLFQYFRGRQRSEADGLLFGVASGMGFAALETMGYGLKALVLSGGDPVSLNQVLLTRGLLSPAAHAAWTGIIVAVIWRERERNGRGLLNMPSVLAFTSAILLHFFWDLINSQNPTTTGGIALWLIAVLTVIVLGLTFLFRRMREASRYRETALAAAGEKAEDKNDIPSPTP